jgi:hypothetical protein
MSFAPKALLDLSAYWESKGGVSLGIVGNKAHTVGYHIGADRIFDGAGPGLGVLDYSVKLTRDRNHVTNAAAALDIGRLDGSLKQLYAFSRWLVSRCKAEAPGTTQIREIIYSPDGEKVQRYSGEDGAIHTGPGNGDLSHRTHTHISFYRDTETNYKVLLFAPFFEDAPPPPPEPPDTGAEPVQSFRTPELPTTVFLPTGARLYTNSAFDPTGSVFIDPGRRFSKVGDLSGGDIVIVAYEKAGPEDPGPNSRAMFVKASHVSGERTPASFTKAEVNDAFNDGRDAVLKAGATVPRR